MSDTKIEHTDKCRCAFCISWYNVDTNNQFEMKLRSLLLESKRVCEQQQHIIRSKDKQILEYRQVNIKITIHHILMPYIFYLPPKCDVLFF